MARSVLLASLVIYCCWVGAVVAELVNVEIKRKIDVKSNVELATTTIRMRNDGESSVESFKFSLNPRLKTKVGDMFAASGPKVSASSKLLSISPGELPHTYVIKLPSALAAGEETTVTLSVDVLSSLVPMPAEIKAKEDQFMRYEGDAYFYSPYRTESVHTVVALPSARVRSSNIGVAHDMKPYQVVLGPYEDVAAHTSELFDIRFKNNRGFIVAERALIHYHVSHWGRIAVREEFELRNDAARLVGEWSRADYDPNYGKVDPTAHGDVWANLPADATDISYKDLIGNITTSRLRKPTRKNRPIQLTFRFPLLGGWRTHFWYTYTIALAHHTRSANKQHQLTLPVLPSMHYDLPIEEHVVSVALPEEAENIEVEAHPSIDFQVEQQKQASTLSFRGRPVLLLKRRNVRSQAPHARDVVIRYEFGNEKLLIAPSFITTGFMGVFAIAFVLSRYSFVLVHDAEDAARKKSLSADVKEVHECYAKFSDVYSELQALYNQVRFDGEVPEVNAKRGKLSAEHSELEKTLEGLIERLRALDPAQAERAEQLLKMLQKKRDYSLRFVSLENSFRNGDMRKMNYEIEMARIAPAAKRLSLQIVSTVQKLSVK